VDNSEIDALRMEFGDRLGALELKTDAILAALAEIKLKLGIKPTLGPAYKARGRDGASAARTP